MSDVLFSVGVKTEMEALSKGLKRSEKEVTDFAANSESALKGLESTLKSLGVGMSTTGLKGLRAEIVSQRLENEKLRTSILETRAAQASNTAAISNARASAQQNTAALIQQRIATEAHRTATNASRAAQAALNLQNGTSRTTMRALSGSYDEARNKMNALGREIRAAGGAMNSSNPAIAGMVAEYNRLNESLKRVDATMGNHQRKVGDYSGAISGAASALTGMAGGVISASALLSMAFSTALKTDAIKTSLEFTFGSVDVARVKMDGLRFTANRLGLEYVSLADAYRSFAGAAVASNFPLKETDRIFNAVANAGAKMKLTTDQVSGALTALQQMISKGTVQSEELRGQLGERLPGAFAIAARAMGVTQQELGKLLQDGKVAAADLLPKLADELDKTFSNDKTERVESLGGEVARLQNHFTELVETKGAVTGFFTFVVARAGDVVGAISAMSQALGVFYDLASDPKKLIGDSAQASRGSSYEGLKATANTQASTAVKNEGTKSATLDRITKEIDLLKELDANYKKINETYVKTKAGDRNLADTQKMQSAQTALQSQILFVRALKNEYDNVYKAAAKPTAPVLDSIAKIRKEIALLSATSGSSTKGSDVYNKIVALKAQLKDLTSTPKKATDKVFDSVTRQVQDFQNKSNLITKVGLEKDLQEWDDKYSKIKAVIAKMPAGASKNAATETVTNTYKEGKADIVEANTAKVMQSLKKSQDAIALTQLSGDAKEIQATKDKYNDLLIQATGNKAATAAIVKAQGDEVSALIEKQGARDINTSIRQIADIAKEYRDHKADMFVLMQTDGPLAVEVQENEIAKDLLKKQYSDNLISFADYKAKMDALITTGKALDTKGPSFDIKHFTDVANAAKKSVNDTLTNFVDSGIATAMADSFSGMGAAIAEGGNILQAAGEGLKNTFSQLMSELGKQFITMGSAKIAAGLLMTPFGAKTIAQGAGLVALGAGLSLGGGLIGSTGGKGSSSDSKATTQYGVPQFAMGVQNFGGGIAMVGERGPELVNLPTGADVIPNHKVMQSIAGRGSSEVMIPEVRLSGQDLYIAFKRTEKTNKRL